MKDFALLLIEFFEVPASPFSQPIKVTLDGTTTLWCVRCSSQFCVTSKLVERTLCLILQFIHEEAKQNKYNSIDPWGTTLITSLQLDFMPLMSIP